MSEQFFEHEKKKDPQPVKKKKKRRKKPPIIHTCDSLVYNEFSKYYETKHKEPIKLECDLIKPKLASVSEVLCKTFGRYLIQFGIEVFYSFIKYLFNIEKKQKKGFLSDILKGQIERLVKKFKKGVDKVKSKNKIIQLIDGFYKLNCKKIMPHYNAFYVFYNEYSKNHTTIINTPTCDYFRHISTYNYTKALYYSIE